MKELSKYWFLQAIGGVILIFLAWKISVKNHVNDLSLKKSGETTTCTVVQKKYKNIVFHQYFVENKEYSVVDNYIDIKSLQLSEQYIVKYLPKEPSKSVVDYRFPVFIIDSFNLKKIQNINFIRESEYEDYKLYKFSYTIDDIVLHRFQYVPFNTHIAECLDKLNIYVHKSKPQIAYLNTKIKCQNK